MNSLEDGNHISSLKDGGNMSSLEEENPMSSLEEGECMSCQGGEANTSTLEGGDHIMDTSQV